MAWVQPRGDVDAVDPLEDFDHLYRAYGDRLVRHCRRHLDPAGDAEDAAHEALLKAWAARERFDRDRPVWPWLATIARNACIDQLRRSAPRPLPPWQEVSPPTPEDLVLTAEEAPAVRTLLADLPPLASEALLLRDVQGFGYEEIAAHQARSEGAVRNAVARARKQLREALVSLPKLPTLGPLVALAGLRERVSRRWARGRSTVLEQLRQAATVADTAGAPWLGAAPTAAGQLVLAVAVTVASVTGGVDAPPERPSEDAPATVVAPPVDHADPAPHATVVRPPRRPGTTAGGEPATPTLSTTDTREVADQLEPVTTVDPEGPQIDLRGDLPTTGEPGLPGPEHQAELPEAPQAPAVAAPEVGAPDPTSLDPSEVTPTSP